MIVRTSVHGPFALKIVDVTNNVQKFERRFTERLCTALRSRSVALTADSPLFAAEPHELVDALAGTWNCLLLIAHGSAAATETESATFNVGRDSTPWWHLRSLNIDLLDKAIFLCVCDALNRDSIEVLLREQLGQILVASERTLSEQEAERFFSAIFPELAERNSLSPEMIDLTVQEHNYLTGSQMVVKSAVGVIGK